MLIEIGEPFDVAENDFAVVRFGEEVTSDRTRVGRLRPRFVDVGAADSARVLFKRE